MRRYLVVALGALALSTVPVSAAEKQLDGNGIKSTLTGARVYLRGDNVLIEHKANGTAVGAAAGIADYGKWWVEGDTICSKWNGWAGAKKRCWNVFLDGERLRVKAVDNGQTETGRLAR